MGGEGRRVGRPRGSISISTSISRQFSSRSWYPNWSIQQHQKLLRTSTTAGGRPTRFRTMPKYPPTIYLLHNLGRHPARCSDESVPHFLPRQVTAGGKPGGDAEVGDLHGAVFAEQNVARLYIPGRRAAMLQHTMGSFR